MSISWDKIPDNVFVRKEFDDPHFPGSGDLIDPILLEMMVHLRINANCPIHTMAIVGGAVDVDGSWGHAHHSYHLKRMGCKALDWFFEQDKISDREQYHLVSKMGFGGIGIYRNWKYNGTKILLGFHTDTRPINLTQRWKRVNGIYEYLL